MAIKLYQFAISHYSEKIRWALAHKALAYEPVFLLPGTHINTIKALTGQSSVPVIDHDGTIVQGSAAIIDYLDSTFSEHPLTPADPAGQNEARAWEQRLDTVAGPAVRCYCYHHLLQRPRIVTPLLAAQTPFYNKIIIRLGFSRIEETMREWMKINERTAQQARDTLDTLLTELAAAYQHREYLVGEQFSRADLTAAALLAPLFQPAAYPVPWPDRQRLPAEMMHWADTHRPLLDKLQALYTAHRGA
ncbi:glutathione S-transferase [Marinobacter sp. X15-166B]|nr:glutathione S-transferase [Marinobacter sp. X15-166B]